MKINRNKNSCQTGFTLVEIMIVVAIIGLLAAFAIPNMVRARQTSQTNACIRNLRTLDNAKQQWALELGKQNTETPPSVEVEPYVGRGAAGDLAKMHCPLIFPAAPLGGYDMNAVIDPPSCQQNDALHPAAL
jgi:prepilin-type N-terminal cleavage/methylation domain-containing protein